MGKEDHPAFRYKDFSNRKLSMPELMDEIERIMRMTEEELVKLETDLIFTEIVMKEWGGR